MASRRPRSQGPSKPTEVTPLSSLDLTVGACRVRMTYSTPLGVNHFIGLVSVGHAMSDAISLDWAEFQQRPAQPIYDYRVRLQDGRVWRQVITFAGASDFNPDMTFNVNPGWSLNEFSAMREWRLQCIGLRNSASASLIRLDHTS